MADAVHISVVLVQPLSGEMSGVVVFLKQDGNGETILYNYPNHIRGQPLSGCPLHIVINGTCVFPQIVPRGQNDRYFCYNQIKMLNRVSDNEDSK